MPWVIHGFLFLKIIISSPNIYKKRYEALPLQSFFMQSWEVLRTIHIVSKPSAPSISRTLFIIQNKLQPSNNNFILPTPSSTWQILFYFNSMNLTILATLYKLNHTLFAFMWWTYLTWYNVLKVYPCCSV